MRIKNLLLTTLLHEVEHSKQYLQYTNQIPQRYKLLTRGYGICFEQLLPNKFTLKNSIKYFKDKKRQEIYALNNEKYILERNATLEASNICANLANYNADYLAYKVFDYIEHSYRLIGYDRTKKGCVEQTFKDLLYYPLYEEMKGEVSRVSDKSRYGFELKEYEYDNLQFACKSSYKKLYK